MKKRLYLLVFCSGAAGLMYQVLWLRQLGLLVGNTAHAAAIVLAVFFGGMAAGSWFWGRRAANLPSPLRGYAIIETGIAASAAFFFVLMPMFRLIYPPLYQILGDHVLLDGVKLLLALLLIFPASFFMGGTLPVMGQFLVTERTQFGRTAAWLYGINTVGAAVGTILAAFILVPNIGFIATCILAMAITAAVALSAFRLSMLNGTSDCHAAASAITETNAERGAINQPCDTAGTQPPQRSPTPKHPWDRVGFLAFVSGFSVLALEVAWTRIFAQIHENSVYSFSMVLVIVLTSLALAALIASLLARAPLHTERVLCWLLILSGMTVLFFPFILLELTHELTIISPRQSFFDYFAQLLRIGFISITPACLMAGTVFPFLMKRDEAHLASVGYSLGKLTALNTSGAIVGALLCGFVLLPAFGMWGTVQALSISYLACGLLVPAGGGKAPWFPKAIAGLSLITALSLLYTIDFPALGTNPVRDRGTLLETWDTGDCSVAVVRGSSGSIGIAINSNYTLGSTAAAREQMVQGQLPLCVKPDTESVFFLGLGTGMTAGAILDTFLFPSIKRVVACELVGEVVEASEKYLTGAIDGIDHTGGLFNDPRVEIVIDDGRHYLMASGEKFDMINADLFLPYRQGAGSLYSKEHFVTVRESLSENGVFVQWLPLFQLTDFEFGTICNTLLQVFDHITLWRNNYDPGREIVALVASRHEWKLAANETEDLALKRDTIKYVTWQTLMQLDMPLNETLITLLYVGNISNARERFVAYPINTDDRPIIEYKAPISIRLKGNDGRPMTLVANRFTDFTQTMFDHLPPTQDPFLANRSASNRHLAIAGAALHEAWVAFVMQDAESCRRAWYTFVDAWLGQELSNRPTVPTPAARRQRQAQATPQADSGPQLRENVRRHGERNRDLASTPSP